LGAQLWARGYFCATVGRSPKSKFRNILPNTEEQPPDENFHIDP